ncbi:holo-ACP synthase [Fundicoccus culcitae]|uniref:Holo-[acyl-carrier-protein] synthase n=1 Tax=Fundicoccus culcitae TaxID=2969821 RepID=A0ABY5P3R7_9LACT|nr:holo-ACP synthase [Fundicoccus culcitae]UUX33226.1 holo-ACP synthase [Fundicoccus culcitae]
MRIGTDIIEIERIKTAYERQERFAQKILTPAELAIFHGLTGKRQMNFLAGRFSAKEAYSKALRTGIGKLKFTDISILASDQGVPYLAEAPLIEGVDLSISHSRDNAIATVIINLGDNQIDQILELFFQQKADR